MTRRLASGLFLLLGVSAPLLAKSPRPINAAPPAPPPAVATPSARPAPDMQAVLDAHAALGAQPIEMLTPLKARLQPSAADAAHAIMRRQSMSTTPDPAVVTLKKSYGPDAMQYARIYKPAASGGARCL